MTPPRVPLPEVAGGPEILFQLGPVTHPDGLPHAQAPTGPWMTGPGGAGTGLVLGSLGVLVDDVLGLAISGERPVGQWSVSTEITLERMSDPSPRAATILARTGSLHVDGSGGLAVGLVTDDTGTVVARASQRGRFVPGEPGPVSGFAGEVASAGAVALIGLEVLAPGLARLPVAPSLVNPLGNLHGGISLCAADLVAADLVAADLCAGSARPGGGPVLRTASLHVAYVRPVPLGAVLELEATVVHRGRSLAVLDVTGRIGARTCITARVVAQP